MTSRASIGGPIDWASLYGRRDQHRPNDAAGIAAAARDLAATGLKPRDIATTLGVTETAVMQILDTSLECQQ